MKLRWLAIMLMSFAALPAGAQQATESKDPATLQTQKEKLSYGIGANAAKNFRRLGTDLDLELVIRGLRDGYSGKQLLISEEEINKVIAAYQQETMAKQAAEAKIVGEKNKKEGDAFLAANKAKEGIVTLPSGLQYKIIKAGDGKKPTEKDTVQVNYRGTLLDGTEFDSSYKRGEPLSFPLNRIIPGWKEALQLMPVGSKWQLFIPPELAYGARGTGDQIGPNATLIFEVELLAIK